MDSKEVNKELKRFRKKLLTMAHDCALDSNLFEQSLLYSLYSQILYCEYQITNYHFPIGVDNFIFNDLKENCSNE